MYRKRYHVHSLRIFGDVDFIASGKLGPPELPGLRSSPHRDRYRVQLVPEGVLVGMTKGGMVDELPGLAGAMKASERGRSSNPGRRQASALATGTGRHRRAECLYRPHRTRSISSVRYAGWTGATLLDTIEPTAASS
jgi:hypothetical protein